MYSTQITIDGDIENFYNTKKEHSLFGIDIQGASGIGFSFFANSGVQIGDSGLMFKWDNNAGVLIMFLRGTQEVKVRFKVSGWQSWKTL